VPLAIAGHVGAVEEVKQMLFEAHRGAVVEKGLCDVVMWGVGAVRRVLEAQPEVRIPHIVMVVSMIGCFHDRVFL
jgi:hypothetical protein